MKKKPIYLYVLLTLSAIISSLGVFGVFFGSTKVNTELYKEFPEEVAKQTITVTEKSLEFLHNGPNKALALLAFVILVAAIVFLIKKNILYANLVYIAYLLVAIIGIIYSYLGSLSINNLYQDETLRGFAVQSTRIITIIYFVINLLFLTLVCYKLWRQQKDLAREES